MKYLKTNDKEYQLRLTTKACVKIESRIGKNPLNVFIEASDNQMPRMSDLMIILHECLLTVNHGISLDDVYDIYDKYCEAGGNFMTLIELLIQVFEESGFIPKEDEVKN